MLLTFTIHFNNQISLSKALKNKIHMEHLYNSLYSLTLLEMERVLTNEEVNFYIYCYNTLNENNVEIDFAVVI